MFGLVLMAGGLAVLAAVRPWRGEPDEPDEPVTAGTASCSAPIRRDGATRPSPSARRRPRPAPRSLMDDDTVVLRRYRVDTIPRGRRVPAEPGRPEIPLPDWLGPVTGRH